MKNKLIHRKYKVINHKGITLKGGRHGLKAPTQAKIFKSEREYFRLGAESYSSLGHVGKKRKRKYSRPLLAKFACGQVSSPRLYVKPRCSDAHSEKAQQGQKLHKSAPLRSCNFFRLIIFSLLLNLY